ncbi:serine/threonine protein kinase [Allochromatium warmingii]|uniref:Serine/threonine protein kinase n=1 Tax=Allochromatium warmingii TaxID=61595 RepID=A0A1H3FM49_ALLWA|nr:serine/threonine-protein kinase [Allochromatium warmingii]SDX91458.1 serine/threonine protein kinase [Allochromatium warmingii]
MTQADLSPSDATLKFTPTSIPVQDAIGPGTLLVNTYLVESRLGQGGMGEVYLARHVSLGTAHAIKVIRSAMTSDQQVMSLFYREAMVLRGVRHEAIVNYDGFVRDDQGRDYLVMEYVEGESLADRLKHGPLTTDEVLRLRDRLCSGLAEAHRRGAVHRDLSPDNVILQNGHIDSAKLIDFGLCKLTAPNQGTIIGTSFAGKYRYAAPEQFGLYGMEIDARTDIYSLGLIIVAAALGTPLDMGNSLSEAIHKRREVPDLSALPEHLRTPLALMLQPNPADRPSTIEALLDCWSQPLALHSAPPLPRSSDATVFIVPESSSSSPSSTVTSAAARRWPLLITGAGVVAALSGGAFYAFYWVPNLPSEPISAPTSTLTAPTPVTVPEPEPTPLPASTPKPDLPQPPPAPLVAETPPQPAPAPAPSTPPPPQPPQLDALIAAGQLDAAFALVETQLAEQQAIPTETLWTLAKQLHTSGRLDPAFAVLRSLAQANFGPALFALGEFYDPLYWSTTTSPLSKPNPERARAWYERAAAAGIVEARARLDALRSRGSN